MANDVKVFGIILILLFLCACIGAHSGGTLEGHNCSGNISDFTRSWDCYDNDCVRKANKEANEIFQQYKEKNCTIKETVNTGGGI